MTQQLSLAARSVFESFNSKFDWVEDGVPGPQFNAIAAALRAAAEQIEDLYCADLVIDDSDGAVFVLRQLMLIADELEAQ
jgi:hypothetical protein